MSAGHRFIVPSSIKSPALRTRTQAAFRRPTSQRHARSCFGCRGDRFRRHHSMTEIAITTFRTGDLLGAAVSSLCAVHCMATPIVFATLPSLGGWFAHPAAHWILAGLALPFAIAATVHGYRRHRRVFVPVLLGVGLTLILIATAAPAFAGGDVAGGCAACCPTDQPTADVSGTPTASGWTLSEWMPSGWTLITIIGGVLLLSGHAMNFACCRCCTDSQSSP